MQLTETRGAEDPDLQSCNSSIRQDARSAVVTEGESVIEPYQLGGVAVGRRIRDRDSRGCEFDSRLFRS